MEFFRTDTHIDFMGRHRLMAVALAVLIAISLGAIFIRGLEPGLDFTGGTLVEVSYTAPVELAAGPWRVVASETPWCNISARRAT